jgi:hypothetical protein
MPDYPNWFALYADQYFERHLTDLAGKPGLRFLQIGVFTGDATMWLCDRILTGDDCVLFDVDTWEGSDEPAHDKMDFSDVERVYDERTAWLRADKRVVKIKATSAKFLTGDTGRYDFIYIDGDHTAPAVLSDAVHAWPLVTPGGLLAFDDYLWQHPKGHCHTPRPAIDAFGECYAGHGAQVLELGSQAWFRKS